ncbi:MAG TPA: ATP-binding cassette domain-containing protein [Sedimentisphaerales bacterium]|jgi:putative ABC transport system ATP-binding protein|nr:ATP-binding cassette domain-containing protein [Sedimentisphaerales bacterium]
MLEFKNVSKWFSVKSSKDNGIGGKVTALKEVAFSVRPGELLAVRGPSGCGKTTLLLTAGGLLRPSAGQITVAGQDPYELDPEQRCQLRARMIGFVFQQFSLIPYLTVRQNILAASLALPGKKAPEKANSLIDRFGLADRADHVPAQLSTGERQRTALARALLNEPKIILADEPTGNLDEDNAQTVFGTLSQYVSDGGCVLLVTHDARAAAHATRTIQMSRGQVLG